MNGARTDLLGGEEHFCTEAIGLHDELDRLVLHPHLESREREANAKLLCKDKDVGISLCGAQSMLHNACGTT
jgi:hypothetical protein